MYSLPYFVCVCVFVQKKRQMHINRQLEKSKFRKYKKKKKFSQQHRNRFANKNGNSVTSYTYTHRQREKNKVTEKGEQKKFVAIYVCLKYYTASCEKRLKIHWIKKWGYFCAVAVCCAKWNKANEDEEEKNFENRVNCECLTLKQLYNMSQLTLKHLVNRRFFHRCSFFQEENEIRTRERTRQVFSSLAEQSLSSVASFCWSWEIRIFINTAATIYYLMVVNWIAVFILIYRTIALDEQKATRCWLLDSSSAEFCINAHTVNSYKRWIEKRARTSHEFVIVHHQNNSATSIIYLKDI